jgi:hypothetical protein
MKRVLFISPDDEPEWECFMIQVVDFRPNWDGDFVSVWTTIHPQGGLDETKLLATACARKMVEWVLENAHLFGKEDRFQIIVGWAKNVQCSARQIIKVGGDFKMLKSIASGSIEIEMRQNWAIGLFEPLRSNTG